VSGEVSEAWTGKYGAAFDGRVVEIFGYSDAHRYHLREVEVDVSDPDRKGQRRVRIGRSGGGPQFKVGADDWPAWANLLGRIAAMRSD
jgi:hypothetical protein